MLKKGKLRFHECDGFGVSGGDAGEEKASGLSEKDFGWSKHEAARTLLPNPWEDQHFIKIQEAYEADVLEMFGSLQHLYIPLSQFERYFQISQNVDSAQLRLIWNDSLLPKNST